jgi:hypothetical protein
MLFRSSELSLYLSFEGPVEDGGEEGGQFGGQRHYATSEGRCLTIFFKGGELLGMDFEMTVPWFPIEPWGQFGDTKKGLPEVRKDR